MTAEENIMNNVHLLPLPDAPCRGKAWEPQYRESDMQAYARACASSVTEALRAEVLGAVGDAMQARAELKEWRGAAETHKNRAERMAEALRGISELDEREGDSLGNARSIASDALEQERS